MLGEPLVYTTRDCWTVTVNATTITIQDPAKTGEHTWGDPHENLRGRHVKDWLSTSRSVTVGGAMITMIANGLSGTGVVQTLTLYDGPVSYSIANEGSAVFAQTYDEASTVARKQGEADSETGCLANKADGGLLFDNINQQDADINGTPLEKVSALARIGETFGPDNPNQVN